MIEPKRTLSSAPLYFCVGFSVRDSVTQSGWFASRPRGYVAFVFFGLGLEWLASGQELCERTERRVVSWVYTVSATAKDMSHGEMRVQW